MSAELWWAAGAVACTLAIWVLRSPERRADRRARVLAAFERYPGQRLYGGDVARMAWASLFDLYALEEEGLLVSDWAPGPEPRRRLYWRTDVEVPR